MASVRPGRTTVELVCPVCDVTYFKEKAEHTRNLKKGRTSVCGRKCHAVFMNKSPKKLEIIRKILAERNSHQWREDNPNWKGGISEKLKDPPTSEE